ncbi:hypothetical protein [Gloeocapsopsis dulcis]|uniref:hypothetical protein n=1 Tax=Gloeocapsopsis dulcis TaxID=2859516 RepID=UPI002B258AD6|nr:hypothetical protein [Gloeocapsopsis dulcis]WNN89707.1 hypothetical protein P0S91_01000 [Gloeocapsopsis dulcis]WNN91551.1 hypothetical protein P0S91_10955 [Gloeocapsopsis dulcis]
MKRTYRTIWVAIAFTLACEELSRRTGVAAADWHSELRKRAFNKLNRLSDSELAKYIKDNFDE